MQNKVTNFNNAKNAHLKPMPAYARILDIESENRQSGSVTAD